MTRATRHGYWLFAVSWLGVTTLAWGASASAGHGLLQLLLLRGVSDFELLSLVNDAGHAAGLIPVILCQAALLWRRGWPAALWLVSLAPWLLVTMPVVLFPHVFATVDGQVVAGLAVGATFGALLGGLSAWHRASCAVVGVVTGAALGTSASLVASGAWSLGATETLNVLGILGASLAQAQYLSGARGLAWIVATFGSVLFATALDETVGKFLMSGARMGGALEWMLCQYVVDVLPGASLGLFTAAVAPLLFGGPTSDE